MKNSSISLGTSYYGTHFPWQFEQDLIEMKNANMKHIVYAASEYELGFYLPSTIEFSKIAKQHNIEFFINFWAHGNAFGGEGGSFFIYEHPNTWQITKENKKIPAACFNQIEFLSFMKKQIAKIANHCDGIFFDEPAFYSNKVTEEYGCYCEICNQQFKTEFKKTLKDATQKELAKFRNSSLIKFINTLAKEYKKQNPNGKTIICLYPAERDNTICWTDFLNLNSIDVFGSDPYWKDPYWIEFINKGPIFVEEVGKKVVQQSNSHNKQSQIWIQNFKLENVNELYDAIQYAKKCNPNYITAWTYKGACFSELENNNWKKGWELLIRAYKE